MCYSSRMEDSGDVSFDKILESYGVSISEYSDLFTETFKDTMESNLIDSK